MPERVELPDPMPVERAMEDPDAIDSMLAALPGGEMARGDSALSMHLLECKHAPASDRSFAPMMIG
jgi:hypothetical protein